jgi:hypothetical protein
MQIALCKLVNSDLSSSAGHGVMTPQTLQPLTVSCYIPGRVAGCFYLFAGVTLCSRSLLE